MISKTKQNWQIGSTVKVGFLTLTVLAAIKTPGDGLPDVYFLRNAAGDKLYEFTPHNGCRAVSLDEVTERVKAFRAYCELVTAEESARSAQRDLITAKFGELFPQVAA